MTIYIIFDKNGNVPQNAKPFADMLAALTYYIDKAKKYKVKYNFNEVINNPSVENIMGCFYFQY